MQNPKVQAVRDRMAVALYGDEAALMTFTGPVFPVRANRSHLEATLFDENVIADAAGATTADDDVGVDASQVSAQAENEYNPMDMIREDSRFDEFGNLNTRLNFGGYAPVTLDNEVGTVPWETWTYTRIGNGMEITFTDERGTGAFDFAPIPPPSLDTDVSRLARFTEYAPRVVFRNAVARVPDVYNPAFHQAPLDFYFDLASFRAPEGGTTLEVYYGIPAAQVEVGQRRDVSYIQVRCALALAPTDYSVIHRTSSSRAYRVASDFSGAQKAFYAGTSQTPGPAREIRPSGSDQGSAFRPQRHLPSDGGREGISRGPASDQRYSTRRHDWRNEVAGAIQKREKCGLCPCQPGTTVAPSRYTHITRSTT